VAAMNQAYSGSIHASSDKDYYKVTMEADGALQVKFTHNIVAGSESSKLWNISVYRSTDLSNAVFTQTVIGGDKTTTTAQMGLKKGDYYVLVAPESSIKYDDTTYKIQMNYTKSAYWEKEDNDSSQTATAISNFDKKYSGSIYKQADTDWYEVTLAGNGGFGLTFTNAVVEGSEGKAVWKVSIYKSSDVKTAVYEQTITGGDTKTVMPQIGMKKGTYYVCVQSGRSSTFSDQTYKLKVNYDQSDYWEIEGNDAFDTATTLTSGKTYTGSIKTKDDYDYYRIDTKKKGYLQFKLTQSSKSTDKIYRIKVYNGDKTELYSTEVAGNDATFNSCKIGVDKGTYYVRIEEYVSLYTGNYKLTVTGTAASNWETEVNDNRTAADKMTVGTTIYGVCDASYAKDDDYYKFTLDKAAYVNVSLSHKDLNGSSTAWSIYIYDSNGRRVDHKNDYLSVKQSGTYAETNCVKLPKGTYYIQVRATEYGTGVEYGLTVNKISAKTPVISSVTAKAYNQMKVSWSVVPGASKYMIYRSTSKNGKYSLVKTISSAATTSWTDKDVKTGKTYYYKIKASVTTNKTTTSGYSKVKSAKCVPAKPAGVKAASSTKNQVKVSWNKVSGASGYEIYRKEKNGEYKKIKTITNGSTVTYTDKSAKSGKTYTYKIRAYRTVDSKKVYSSYSKEVTQKAK
jgi:hypothetical protein